MTKLRIGLTTAPDEKTAKHLAAGLIQANLAACVQISSPMTSFYWWNKKLETTQEYQLVVKHLATNSNAIAQWLNDNHPYETPEWIANDVDFASSAYLAWAQSPQ